MNKKQGIKIVVFIGIFLILLQTITYIIRTNGDVKDRFVGFYAEKQNTIDVIMIGSSPVYPCFSGPQIFGEYGITCYPLSSNVQRPQAALGLVREARKTQDPKLFVFEIKQFTADFDEATGNMAYTRGVTDNMKYSINRIRTIHDMVSDASERYTYYFDIFKYHSNWKTLVMPSQLRTFRYEYPNEWKGFVMKDGVRPANYVDYSGITKETPIPSYNEKSLRELLTYLKLENLNAIFVLAPYELESEVKQENFNYCESIIQEYGYEFLNMNESLDQMEFDFSRDFYDGGIHTNAVGSEKCSKFFAEYMINHYDFNDKRGVEGYESWEMAYQLWKSEFPEAKNTIAEAVRTKQYTEIEEEE